MGPLIATALEDPDVVEIMLNPDRTLWVDRLSSGRAPMGVELPEADGERIIRLVATHVGAEVHRGQPLLSAELPETGERFEGILPPAAPGPAFALRKRAIGVIPLERYVVDGMMTAAQAGFLVRAVRERQNVLIAGATSSGKTTLANALLAEIAATGDRVLVLEDTVELQCVARDHVPLRTRSGVVSMTELVRSSMRLRPDRVVVGEVRGAEALDLIKVWGTGHPGGIATIHAGSALGALLRMEQLILEVAVNPPRALIAEAVNVVIHIAGRGRKRRIESIARVVGFDGVGYQLADAMDTPTAMTHAHAFRVSVNPPSHLSILARLRCLGRPAGQGLLLAALLLFLAGTAQAAGSSMPWEGPLQSILESIQGPVARIVAVIIIIATGLALAFGDTSGGFRKLIQIVFGLSIAFAASSFFLSFAAGFEVPLHRSLTEPILLGGAPRTVAIANGTLAAAVGLGLQLWIPGVVLWIVGHSLAVWGARVDPQFMAVFARHIKHRPLLDV
ncbi:hypothetical protein BFJ72_g14831 [Fusarium proliferatum]|uniref:Bacterial type II secretion system protein E domain-containing protein n=3 Tax=cellular organisms TaxID=131567 RepID=A0A420RWU4_GIBIN|nr:hypothetical protein BFJ72_g14831 [Fusarium proliferatum]